MTDTRYSADDRFSPQTSHRYCRLPIAIIFCMMLWPFTAICRETIARSQNPSIVNGSWCIRQGETIAGYRMDEPFVPASTVKILTSLVALEQLGPRFRFQTTFYFDNRQNLYVKGYGDPFLTSEILAELSTKLRGFGVAAINHLFLDNTFFDTDMPSPGSENSANPYDTSNASLAVNFNAVPIRKLKNGRVSSAEQQTPTLPLMSEIARPMHPGTERINVDMLVSLPNLPPSLRYTGELIIAQLQQAGIMVHGSWAPQKIDDTLEPILVHRSRELSEILQICLKFSNNFIANQVFLYCGADAFGFPATWQKAQRNVARFLSEAMQLDNRQLHIEDGSGLSRYNRLTTRALVDILDRFRPYSSLLPRRDHILLKSGTMQGVYCYGGYIPHDTGLSPFAILLNQQNNQRDTLLRQLITQLHPAIPESGR